MKSRPTKQKLKQRGILRERVFGCDLGEHLLNSGHDVPQVLKSCTEFIEKHGVVDGMYRLSGIASNIQKLRHEFDSEQIPDLTKDVYIQDIHCVGSLCKLYFRELPNPLLTYQLYEKFSDAVSAATDEERLIKIHDVIQQLPPPHYRTLEFLMRHLSHLATFSYITNMHSKNLAIVWAPNLLRSKQIESACFSGTAAFMEVRIQSVVVEFILNHVDVLFSPKLSSLIREGAGHNSLSRPKSLLVSSPSTKLLTLEEAQARTQAQINSPVTADSKYIEVGEGPAALQGKFHTVIDFPTERKRPPIKSKKSPVGSWRSFFNLGKSSSSMSKRKLHRNPSEPNELKAMALAGGRGDTGTLRSAKSEESLTSLHNVEGESKVYRPRRPRSSSDALSASFNGDLLDSRQHCNSYDNLDAAGDSDGDDGPIRVPALISPPRSAGEDVDLSPPDIGMASLDFDPMSFQCSLPDASYAFPPGEPPGAAGESAGPKRSPAGAGAGALCSEPASPAFLSQFTNPFLSPDLSPAVPGKAEGRKLATSYSYMDKPVQAVSPIKCGKSASLAPLAISESFSVELASRNKDEPTSPPPSAPRDSPPLMGSARTGEPSLIEAFQMELQCKLNAFEFTESKVLADEKSSLPTPPASGNEQSGAVAQDSPQGPGPLSSMSLLPPHPPPKNAARMLALALAESAQQASDVSERSPSEPCTPVSPTQPQEAPDSLDRPLPQAPQPRPAPSEDAGAEALLSPPLAPACSPPPASPTHEPQPQQPSSQSSKPFTSAQSPPPPDTSQDMNVTPPMTPLHQCTTPCSPPAQLGPVLKSPGWPQPAMGQVAASTGFSCSTPATTPSGSCIDTGIPPQPGPVVQTEVPARPPVLPKPSEPALLHLQPQLPTAPQPQTQPQVQLQPVTTSPPQAQQQPQPQPQPKVQPQPQVHAQPPSQPPAQPRSHPPPHATPVHGQPQPQPGASRGAPAPAEPTEKPWEAIKPVQPRTEPVQAHPPHGPTPPTPPVRSLESKLATAALSQTEAAAPHYHSVVAEASGEEPLPHHPPPPRKSSSHQSAYLYHSKGETALLEPVGDAYYHQRGLPVGQPSMAYHYRPDGVSPRLPYGAKAEPHVPRTDHRYATLAHPRSYQQSLKSRGLHRGDYVVTGPGHRGQGYSPADRAHIYPSIRRVHSLHVPSTIRTVPVQRTEVPPDDELFYYQRPVYQCKAYAQPPPPPSQQPASQTDYHVTQLQPYFENGRVQYRYSPYSGGSPLDAPYYDVDPYGTIRLRHFQPHGGRDPGPGVGCSGAKAGGYHYQSHHLPAGKEHSFVSRDMPPAHGSKGAAVYFAWDPEESERLRMHSIRRESRARQKMKGPVMSQYDNVGLFVPGEMAAYETLHLRSKSDPSKAVLMAAEGPEGRYLPRHLVPDSDGLLYMDADMQCQGNGTGDKMSAPAKRSGSKTPHSHAVQPLTRSLSYHQESSRHEAKFDPADDKAGSKHWQQEHPDTRNIQPRFERPDPDRHPNRAKPTSGYYSTDGQSPAPAKAVAPPKPERAHGTRLHHSQTNPELDRDYPYQRHGSATVQSHYDNLDDYHSATPQPQAQIPSRAGSGPGSFPTPGFTAAHSNRAYSTALGQGAFVQAELAMQRPETEIHAE